MSRLRFGYFWGHDLYGDTPMHNQHMQKRRLRAWGLCWRRLSLSVLLVDPFKTGKADATPEPVT